MNQVEFLGLAHTFVIARAISLHRQERGYIIYGTEELFLKIETVIAFNTHDSLLTITRLPCGVVCAGVGSAQIDL